MNTYANCSNEELLEIMDDHGVAHKVIHEAAKRLKQALDEREALRKACEAADAALTKLGGCAYHWMLEQSGAYSATKRVRAAIVPTRRREE